ncbi:MAG: 2-hydroxy-3-oxopropionate reductase [Acidimicrobiia bacterium]|nr:2-hydroxy-3-oxopropionate reductase [Acidimicrobiia bacterium]
MEPPLGSRLGFVGLGVMGQPMALNLCRAGTPMVVWNRTANRCDPLAAIGALVATEAAEVFAACDVVLTMLADERATDEVLARGSDHFGELVRGRTIVQMGTVDPGYSRALANDITAAGGRYVEAPVSGSRGPAEAGQLVAMLAGDPADRARVRSVIEPMCAAAFDCGEVPAALITKFAVNLFLITMVTGLAEAFHFAESYGVSGALLAEIIDAGPMASTVSRAKSSKLAHSDFSVQASLVDVLKNNRLIAEAAQRRGVAAPLLEACHSLYREAIDLGHSAADMAAVIQALRARTAVMGPPY